MSHGHDFSLKVTEALQQLLHGYEISSHMTLRVLRLFRLLSPDLNRIFILWPFLNFNVWISIIILDFNWYFI